MPRLEFLKFKTNQRGISSCDNYIFVSKSEKILSMFSGIDPEKGGSCLTCRFFKYDECFFSTNEIQGIKNRLISPSLDPYSKHHKYKCELCGHEITQILTVLKRFYYKKKEAVEIPLICEICYRNLVKYGNMKKRINRNLLCYCSMLSVPILLMLFFIVFPFYTTLSTLNELVFYLIILLGSILGNVYLSFSAYIKLKALVQGNRVSKSFLNNLELRELIFK